MAMGGFQLMNSLNAFGGFQVCQEEGDRRRVFGSKLIACTEHSAIRQFLFDSFILDQDDLRGLEVEAGRRSLAWRVDKREIRGSVRDRSNYPQHNRSIYPGTEYWGTLTMVVSKMSWRVSAGIIRFG